MRSVESQCIKITSNNSRFMEQPSFPESPTRGRSGRSTVIEKYSTNVNNKNAEAITPEGSTPESITRMEGSPNDFSKAKKSSTATASWIQQKKTKQQNIFVHPNILRMINKTVTMGSGTIYESMENQMEIARATMEEEMKASPEQIKSLSKIVGNAAFDSESSMKKDGGGKLKMILKNFEKENPGTDRDSLTEKNVLRSIIKSTTNTGDKADDDGSRDVESPDFARRIHFK